MKYLIISLLASLSLIVAAADKAITVSAEESERRTGGTVKTLMKNTKKVFLINAQNKASDKIINDALSSLANSINTPIDYDKGVFDFAHPTIKGELSLYVIDDEKMPMSLVAPEGRWAIVNIYPLAKGRGEKPAYFEARVKKEIARIGCMLFGNIGSSYKENLLSFIGSAEELDKFDKDVLPIDSTMRCSKYLLSLGVKPWRKTSYYNACVEGWAPQPTNEYQKAVWDKVHQLPSEPIKIKPESKKVTE